MNLLVKPALCHIDRIMYFCHVAQMSRYQNITRHKKSHLLRISHCVKNVTSIWYLCFYRIVADISRCRNVTSMLQICFTESVAQMSLCQKCHTCCKYVLSSTLSRDASCKNVTPKRHKNQSQTPPVEIRIKTPPMEKLTPPRKFGVDPSEEIWHSDS